MRKYTVSLALTLVLGLSLITPSLAASDTGSLAMYPPYYCTICTAKFQNPESNGNLRLVVNASPSAARKLVGPLGFFCDAMDLIGADFLNGICTAVSHIEDFLDYTDGQMRLCIRLYDAGTNEFVWEGVMKNGDTIFLGNDHPDGYRIECKAYNSTLPFVRLEVMDNLDLIM